MAAAEDLAKIQENLGYSFRNAKYVREALTHSSYAHELPGEGNRDNERLEFLGDAVLGLAAARFLSELFPEAPEGELSRMRAVLVGERLLAEAARRLSLGDFLLLGRGEERSGGRQKQSILAGAAEALVGAVFQDGGWPPAYLVASAFFRETQAVDGALRSGTDAKSRLQELCQERFQQTPHYRLLSQSGPSHRPHFVVQVFLGDRSLGQGGGSNKKEAEQVAATAALRQMESCGEGP